MPPNEPVEETVEELISDVSHESEFRPGSTVEGRLHLLRMTLKCGDWRHFNFQARNQHWQLVGASAKSRRRDAHDLLGSVYSPYFGPFLRHVADVANQCPLR